MDDFLAQVPWISSDEARCVAQGGCIVVESGWLRMTFCNGWLGTAHQRMFIYLLTYFFSLKLLTFNYLEDSQLAVWVCSFASACCVVVYRSVISKRDLTLVRMLYIFSVHGVLLACLQWTLWTRKPAMVRDSLVPWSQIGHWKFAATDFSHELFEYLDPGERVTPLILGRLSSSRLTGNCWN